MYNYLLFILKNMLSCIGLINLKSVKSYLSMFADDIDFKSVKTYDTMKVCDKNNCYILSVSQICFVGA